jgi:hypothetical protein
VEWSAPFVEEKEAAHGIIGGDVGTPATLGVMAHPWKEKNDKNFG